MLRKLLVIALTVLMTTNTMLCTNIYAEGTAENTPFTVETFKTALTNTELGKEGEKNLWRPEGDVRNKRFYFRLDMTTAGGLTAPADTIHITIPASIIDDRDGNPASRIELSIPSQSEVESAGEISDELYWAWRYSDDKENVIIYNVIELGTDQIANNFIELDYMTTVSTFDLKDRDTHTFTATLTYKNDDQNVNQTITPNDINLLFDTYARVESTSKGYPNTRIMEWQSYWGEDVKAALGDDVNDYVYLVWPITSKIVANQPYTISLVDSVKGGVVHSSNPFDANGTYTEKKWN